MAGAILRPQSLMCEAHCAPCVLVSLDPRPPQGTNWRVSKCYPAWHMSFQFSLSLLLLLPPRGE